MKKILCFSILLLLLFLSTVEVHGIENKEPTNKDYIIFIDVNELSLSLLDKHTKELEKTYPIAIGKKETPSPIGQWQIVSKALKKGPFGGYWLGLNAPWDTFGIHGTSNPSSIGSMASNGCIRMYNHDIKEVFDVINYDTQVIVYSGPSWLFSSYDRLIKPGDRGTDVLTVQKALKSLGYFKNFPDGIYDYTLEAAVIAYKEEHNHPRNTTLDKKFLESIGVIKFE